MKKILTAKKWLAKKNLKFIVLPKGVKDVGDIFNSQDFKKFMAQATKKESSKPKKMLSLFEMQTTSVIMGQGRSYLSEYMETLPKLSYDEVHSGKADGRFVAIMDIGDMKL